MRKRLDIIINFSSRFIPYTQLGKNGSIDYLRSKLLYIIILSTIFLGLIAYIPSCYLSVRDNIWSIAIIDTVVYVIIIVIGFSTKISAKFKLKTVLGLFYFLGTTLLLFLGPYGAGFIWLFLFSIFAGIFLSVRAVVVTTVINIISLVLLSLPVILRKPEILGIILYNPMVWMVNCVNFVLINSLLSITLSIIISRLNELLVKEIEYKELLQEEKDKLEVEKEKAQEADKLKTAFLANMSHEIRTPMNGILGFTSLLKNDDNSKIQYERYVDIIQESGKRMLHIIDDIINISQIEAGHIDIYLEDTDLNDLLDKLFVFFKPIVGKKGLELGISCGLPNEKSIIKIDKTKLNQIFTNLINNAYKFTVRGRIDFGYVFKDDCLEFFVKDTGYGIQHESVNNIFKRFHRVENDKIIKQEGTGLGLAISKAFVEMFGGKIWVESKIEKGSTFYFTIPYKTEIKGLRK